MVAHAADEGAARGSLGVVGDGRFAGHHFCLPGGQHVPVRTAFLWPALIVAGSTTSAEGIMQTLEAFA